MILCTIDSISFSYKSFIESLLEENDSFQIHHSLIGEYAFRSSWIQDYHFLFYLYPIIFYLIPMFLLRLELEWTSIWKPERHSQSNIVLI